MTETNLDWRYVAASGDRPAHLIAGPVPYLRDGKKVLALTGHTARVGAVSATTAEPMLPAEYCAAFKMQREAAKC